MLIACQNLATTFEQRTLFKEISLQLHAGQSVWLQGENGAGKTTLLKLLSKLTKPQQGNVKHFAQAAKPGGVIYLHQQPYLFAGTVHSNLLFGLKSLSLSRAERQQACQQALDLAQLNHLADRSAQVLSGGERQRLALARAWVMNPVVLLLDEPSANLDPISLALITQMVAQLQQQGCALMITSHQQTSLTALCQEHWRLTEGKLVCHSPQESAA